MTIKVGDRLSYRDSVWTNSPTRFDHQWLRDGVAIPEAEAGEYTTVEADVGAMIGLSVTPHNAYGAGDPVLLPEVGPVEANMVVVPAAYDPSWDGVVLLSSAEGYEAAGEDANILVGANRAYSEIGMQRGLAGGATFGYKDHAIKPPGLTGSIYVPAQTDMHFVPSDPNGQLAFGNGVQFTIEGWIYGGAAFSTFARWLLNRWQANKYSYALGVGGSATTAGNWGLANVPVFPMSADGLTYSLLQSDTALGATEWAYLSADRDAAGDVRLYVNGVMKGKMNFPAFFVPPDDTDLFSFAGTAKNGEGRFNDLRVTRGVARYASDAGHAVPAGPHPLGADGEGDFYWNDVTLYTRMDERSGQSAYDLSQMGHKISGGGVNKTVAGKFGKGLKTTGTYMAGSAPNVRLNSFDMSDVMAFTVEIFMLRETDSPDNRGGVSFYRIGAPGQRQWAITVINNTPYAWVSVGNTQADVNMTAPVPPLNTYTHLCLERDLSGVTRFYSNGVMVGKDTAWTGAFPSSTIPSQLDVASWMSSFGYGFTGIVDEVRITKGVARYASDNGFAVPTGPFPAHGLKVDKLVVEDNPTIQPVAADKIVELPAPAVEDPEDEAVVTIPEETGSVPDGTKVYLTFEQLRRRNLRFIFPIAWTIKGIISAARRRTVLRKVSATEWEISGGDPVPDPQAPHKYWRLMATATGSALDYATVGELQFRAHWNGPNLAVGGVASADSVWQGGYEADKAFDGSTSTTWSSNANATAHWLAYEFQNPVAIGHARFVGGTTADNYITAGRVEYSDDGVNWWTGWSFSGKGQTVGSYQATDAPWAPVPDPLAAYPHWRLAIKTNNGDFSYTNAVGIELRDAAGVNQVGGGTATAASVSAPNTPAMAFQPWSSDSSNYWVTTVGQYAPTWIAYEFAAPTQVRSVTLTGVRLAARMPKDFDIEFSPDGLMWFTAKSVAGQTGWALGGVDTRVFSIP